MYNEGYAVIARPELAQPVEHFPEGIADAMIDNDFEWAAQNREAILAEWQSRYDSKSEAQILGATCTWSTLTGSGSHMAMATT